MTNWSSLKKSVFGYEGIGVIRRGKSHTTNPGKGSQSS